VRACAQVQQHVWGRAELEELGTWGRAMQLRVGHDHRRSKARSPRSKGAARVPWRARSHAAAGGAWRRRGKARAPRNTPSARPTQRDRPVPRTGGARPQTWQRQRPVPPRSTGATAHPGQGAPQPQARRGMAWQGPTKRAPGAHSLEPVPYALRDQPVQRRHRGAHERGGLAAWGAPSGGVEGWMSSIGIMRACEGGRGQPALHFEAAGRAVVQLR
jgi:hypothetical protein